jgi:PPOX class probable F420-dependent enzyme
MTDEEVVAYVREQRRMQFGSLNRDGSIHLVPINHSFLGDEIAFWADALSQKVVNVRRDPRVTLLMEDGDRMDNYRGVQIRGTARIVEDQESVQAVGDGYFRGFPEGVIPEAVREATRSVGQQRVAVVVTPGRVASWDHSKFPGISALDVGR